MYYDDSIDSSALAEKSYFFKGQASGRKATLIASEMFSWMRNADIDSEYRGTNRWAFRNLNGVYDNGAAIKGAHYFDILGKELLVTACNDKIRLLDSDGVTQDLSATDYTFGDRVVFARLINVLYWVDGRNKIFWEKYENDTWTHGSINTFADGVTPLPEISYICKSKGRLLVFDKNSDIMWASSILAVTSSDVVSVSFTDGIRVGNGDGDNVQCAVPWVGNFVVVCKGASIWIVDADPSINPVYWTKDELSSSLSVLGDAAVRVNNDVWLLTADGVFSVKKNTAGDDALIGVSLTDDIMDVIERVNLDAAHNCWGCYHNNRVIFGVPVDGSADVEHMCVYNARTQNWVGLWDQSAAGMLSTRFNGVRGAACYRSDGEIRAVAEDSDRDKDGFGQETWVSGELYTKAYTFGDDEKTFDPDMLKIEFRDSKGVVDVYIYKDGTRNKIGENDKFPPVAIETGVYTNSLPTFPWVFPIRFTWDVSKQLSWVLTDRGLAGAQEIIVKIVFGKGRVRLREVYVSAFPNTIVMEEEI